jgi:pilus assembly protein CpaF
MTESLVDRVRRQLVESGATASATEIAAVVGRQPQSAILGANTLHRLSSRVREDLTGPGPLAPLLADPSVCDVLVNGVQVWIDRGHGLELTDIELPSPDAVRRLAQRLAASCGRRLDDGCPYADAWLPGGYRMHAVLPPIARTGPYLSLRVLRHKEFALADLVSGGAVPGPLAELLTAVVAARLAYVVTGGTGTGKTTVMAALLGLVPPEERIVIVEDAAELRPVHPHVVGLVARGANVEDSGAITLRDLVRQALRMRPDRLVVGECRGAEVVDLLSALNTGHEGGCCTLHANSAHDVPARWEALGLLGGVPREALHAQLAAALRVVVHLRRLPSGRVLDQIALLRADRTDWVVRTVPVWERGIGIGPAAAELAQLFGERGVPVPRVLSTAGLR